MADFHAVVENVQSVEDHLDITILYTNGPKSFTKIYPFVHMGDMDSIFNLTIQAELVRINDLLHGYTTIKAREGEIIYQA